MQLLFVDTGSVVQASAVLVLLAGGILVYRTFRERYLLAWLFGWVAYLLHKLCGAAATAAPAEAQTAWLTLSQIFFTAAIFLMAAAVFYYTNKPRWVLGLAVVGMVALDAAVIRVVWFPQSALFEYATEALFMVIKAAAAVQMALFSRGRRSPGPWLLTVTFLLVHSHAASAPQHAMPAADLIIELLLALSMLVIVLDDAQTRTRRLAVVAAITTAIAEARDFRRMMEVALEELKNLFDARAAWFRNLSDDRLVLAVQLGSSDAFVQWRQAIPLEGSFSGRIVRKGMPGVLRASAVDAETRRRMELDGFDHIVLVPVHGKSTAVGMIGLAIGAQRSYRPDELEFLVSTANQLGIACENAELFEQITRSQRQWTNTFDSIDDGILVHDQACRIVKVNRALLRKLGKEYRDVVGAACEAVLPGGGLRWTCCPYCSRGEVAESPDPCFPGHSLVSTSSYGDEDGAPAGTVHVIQDTSARRAAEERHRLFFERVQEGVFVSTPDGRLLDCNDAFVQMLGYASRQELLAVDIAHDLYVSPEQRDHFRVNIERHGVVRDFEFDLRRKDGSIIKVRESSFAIYDAAGKVERYQGFLLDVTETRRAEEEIRRRNRELHVLNSIATIANQSFDLDQVLPAALRHVADLLAADTGAIYLFDEQTLLCRRRAAFGHLSELGRDMAEFRVPPEFWEVIASSRPQVITQQHLPHVPPEVRAFVSAESLQSWMWVLLWAGEKVVGLMGVSSRQAREFSPADENLLLAVARQLATTVEKVRLYDETRRAYEDLSRTQEQLLQSEKMSAIGQLISGVAHELNNPLTAILGYAQLLENEDLGARSRDFVGKLYRQAQRTHKIVQNLLSFSRQRKPEKQPVDLRRVLEETLALRDYDLKLNNVTVEREFESPLPSVVADPHQMEQVFLNIINNAVDAMLESARGGMLRVRIFAGEGSVHVEFHDSGPGIRDPKRIFDPFYTTKGVGKGTGLGLSICYGILKEHQGEIAARNHPQGGAVIALRLPVSATPAETDARARAARKPASLHGRVLVVDDEEAVLEFEAEVLRGAGAEVVTMTSGEEAIAALQAEPFDAVIIDGKMPGGWTGMDVYTWVAEHRPGLERSMMFAISNFGDTAIRRFIEDKKVPCIVKPFEVADLIAMARRLLKKSRAVAAGN